MTLSSQLEATAPARVRKSVTVVPPEQHGRHGGRGDHQHHGGGGLRNTLQSLLRSTGNLSASVANAVDETAATFVRTLSYRRRKKKPSTSSQWKSYASMSIDEESASERRDGDDDGLSSGAGSTLSLADDAAYVPGAPRPLRRTLSFVEPGTVGANGPVNGVAMRPRSGSHAGQHSEFRRSVGSLPIEYAALAAHGRRHSRSREHMHSAWSTSLTSLQEDVIADAVLAGSVGSLADGVRRSYDSVFMSTAVDGLRNGLDEVDGAAAEPLRAATDSIEAPILGLRGPPWLLYHRAVSGSLPSVAAHRAPERPCLARSVSTASQPAHHELDKTRSRSLTHIAALDMDAGRPDRLVVPPASDNRHHTLRRQNFTSRSQLSSSEYFFVTFELPGAAEGTPDAPLKDEEYIVAAKGTTLEEALVGACHRRGISLSSVSVFLDRVELSLHAESTVLAGKQLRIRPKQDGKSSRALTRAATSQQPQLRKSSSSVRNNRRFFSTSTEDASFASPQADLLDPEKGKTAKARQRWSLFGNNKDTKMGALSEQLDNFTKYGIPKEHKSTETDERLYHLEDNWRGLLDGSDTLPERLQQQQDAVWELLQTELAYIRTLTVVKDVFLACLSSLQEARILTEVDKGRLFGNIVDIHAANAFFWEQFLAPVVAAARDGRQPLNPSHLLEGFLKFEEIFRPYVQYCVEQAECSKYCRERTADGELFTVYLAWCETHEETHVACNRLQLVDILVMPMQRLTRYSLLLKAILKKTDCEEQSKDLKFMIRKVDDFVNSVNSKLREREDQDKLNAIIARMEPYDVVESKDEDLDKMVKLHSLLDLTRPMPDCPAAQRRYLLQEGDLRLRDLNSSKADVHCFLFTDMLLVCKSKKGESRTARVRVLRPPYLVERLVINELARDQPTLACVYLNEYKVVVSAFLLTSADGKVIKRWAEDIRKAQRLYAQAKEAGATSASTAPPQYHAPPLSLSRQPSSLYDEDLVLQGDDAPEADTHSYASYSLGLYPHHRSPRGSTRGSSLNHSHSGSVEMNEASSLSSVSHSRGISVDNNELRASSLSSDEGIPPLGADQAGAGAGHPGGGGAGPGGGPGGGARGLRRSQHSKSPSPNTLSIQVPVFSNLGQSLPNLNLAASSPHGSLSGPTVWRDTVGPERPSVPTVSLYTVSGPQPPCSLLLVPPTGKGGLHHHHQHHGPLSPGHRGTSYPPPSPPRGSLHRWTPQRNPPLMKMRHVSASVSSQQSCSGPAPPGVTWAAPAASAAAAPAAAAPSGPQPGPGAQQGSPTSTPMPSNFDFDVPLIGGVSPPAGEAAAQQSAQGGGAAGAAAGGAGPGQQPSPTSRQTFMMKRLTRGDNRRYHTAGTIDDVKKAEGRDATIHKRFSWNYGPQSCGKRQSSGHEDGAQGQQDVLLIDRATSPLKPPPQHITDAAWSRVHAGSTERTNSFPEPVQFQSPSVGSSPSVSLCGDCPPCCGPGAGPGPPPAAANVVASVTSSPALSTTSPVQLPSLNTSPTTCPDAGLELASSNPFLEDVVGQDMDHPVPLGNTNPFLESTDFLDEPLPSTHGFPSDEVLVLITDAQVEYTDA